jgi:N-acetylmuramoyl-L-alanine amidase
MMKLRGKVSWFGGPDDTGVAPDEGLAFIYEIDDAPHLFLPTQPPGTTGLARRLNPNAHYVACRWDYDEYPKPMLLEYTALVRNLFTDKVFEAYPADWGPHQDTDRVADISPGLMEELDLETDDEVEVVFPYKQIGRPKMSYQRIVISSGHGLHVRGAHGILDEVDEARRVVERVAEELRNRGVEVDTFHDDTSHSQNENLHTIVDYHNEQTRDLDVSVHFNAFEQTDKPMGTEVLYVTQSALAGQVSEAVAKCGFINRGAKKRSDLYFLNNTEMPAILIETCFVDSTADAELYGEQFVEICDAIASVLGGEQEETEAPPPDETLPPDAPDRPPLLHPSHPVRRRPVQSPARVDIVVSGDCVVTVNGVPVP